MLIIIILATAFSVNASAQSDTVKYVYAELVGTQRFLSTKVTVQIDFGQATKWTTDNRVRDEVTGKLKLFNSMVDALNYMGEDGWEFVQAYAITEGSQNVYHWLLKKRKYPTIKTLATN
jgi:hypothetical protein